MQLSPFPWTSLKNCFPKPTYKSPIIITERRKNLKLHSQCIVYMHLCASTMESICYQSLGLVLNRFSLYWGIFSGTKLMRDVWSRESKTRQSFVEPARRSRCTLAMHSVYINITDVFFPDMQWACVTYRVHSCLKSRVIWEKMQPWHGCMEIYVTHVVWLPIKTF